MPISTPLVYVFRPHRIVSDRLHENAHSIVVLRLRTIQPCDISIRAGYVAVCAGRDLHDNFPAPLHGWAVSSDNVIVMSAIVLLHSQRRTAALYSEYGTWKLRSRNRSSRGMIMIEMKLANAARATSSHRLFNQSANPRRNKTKATKIGLRLNR